MCYNSSSLHVITAKKQKFGLYFEKKWVILCLRSDLGTFGPKGPENLGIGPKRVHWTTFCNVEAENGTFEPQKGLKSQGYTRAKKLVFWYPTLIPIFGGPSVAVVPLKKSLDLMH